MCKCVCVFVLRWKKEKKQNEEINCNYREYMKRWIENNDQALDCILIDFWWILSVTHFNKKNLCAHTQRPKIWYGISLHSFLFFFIVGKIKWKNKFTSKLDVFFSISISFNFFFWLFVVRVINCFQQTSSNQTNWKF